MNLQDQILANLKPGYKNAIGKTALANICGTSERIVRRAIDDLIQQGQPIGSSTDKVYGGYFYITNEQDAAIAVSHLKNRINKIAVKVKALETLANVKFSKQLSISSF